MNTSTTALPTLRFRNDSDVGYYEKPISFVGKIVGVRDHWFRVNQGRDMETELCVDDFYDILDGPDAALTLLIDAGLNEDVVKISLAHGRLSYDNEKQIERLSHLAEAEKAAGP